MSVKCHCCVRPYSSVFSLKHSRRPAHTHRVTHTHFRSVSDRQQHYSPNDCDTVFCVIYFNICIVFLLYWWIWTHSRIRERLFFPSSLPHTRFPCSTPVPDPPLSLEGEAVGSNGILLSWTMTPDAKNIDEYVIRYFFVILFHYCGSTEVVSLKFSVQEGFIVCVYDDRIANGNHVLSHAEIMKMSDGELPNMQLSKWRRRAMPANKGKKVNGHIIFLYTVILCSLWPWLSFLHAWRWFHWGTIFSVSSLWRF